jgi:hypothetical protein
MHPVAVSEPYTQGHCFGNLGIADYGAQFQDVSSFLVNSHMDNIKSVLNNMLIVDPSMIEMQDVKRPGPGKLIRLKRAAYGQDVRNAIQQLQVTDITRANVADLETFSKISQIVTGVNENTMGIQDSGGRKTATEVRTAGEAAVSRMAFRSRLISAQFMVDATEQMAMNNVQFLSQPFYLQVMGRDGLKRSLWISPEMLVGDYYFPIHDGTLPLDRVALLDVWREVFMAILGDQELRGMYDIGRVFEHIAELGGVKNLEAMRNTGGMGAGGMGAGGMGAEIFGGMRVRGEEGIDAGVKSGNMVPMGRPFGGNTNDFAGLGRGAPPAGISPQPGRRLAGAY